MLNMDPYIPRQIYHIPLKKLVFAKDEDLQIPQFVTHRESMSERSQVLSYTSTVEPLHIKFMEHGTERILLHP